LHTALYLEPSIRGISRTDGLPVIAFGSGITLGAVLNVLHEAGIPSYALCPESDFVCYSRWYRALPTTVENPQPAKLEALLNSLAIPEAVLLPCSDDWLRAMAALPASYGKRFPSCSPGKWVEALVDKWRFSQLLLGLQVPHPHTHLISSVEQISALPASAFQGAILKPLSSVDFAVKHGVKGYMVENREEALAVFRRLDIAIMLQEFIPGPPDAGYFLDGFRDRGGQISALFARRRLRMYPPQLGNSTVTESVPLGEVQGAALWLEFLLKKMAYRGIFSAEFKYDQRDGLFKLIEINARPWWYVEFAKRCGVDVCSMAYRDALGMQVHPVTGYEIGRRCVFTLNDLRAWRDASNGGITGLFPMLRTWISSDSTPFHWNDPGPALQYLRTSVTNFLRSKLLGTASESWPRRLAVRKPSAANLPIPAPACRAPGAPNP
jgi:D-aspartate ligase